MNFNRIAVYIVIVLTGTLSSAVMAADAAVNQPVPSSLQAQKNVTISAAPVIEPIKDYKIPAKYKYLFAESKSKETIPKIHLEEAKVLIASGKALFIDARGTAEYNMGHIPGSEVIGVSEAPSKIPMIKDKLQDKVLVTYCHGAGCHLSDKVANALFDAGYRKILIYFGGWPEWTGANMPIQKYEPPAEYKYLFEDVASEKEIRTITISEAKFLYDNGLANFIDVDKDTEFSKIRIDRAFSIPLEKMTDMIQSYSGVLSQKPNVLYCHGIFNGKSKKAAEKIFKAGYKKLLILTNALPQWEKSGLPLYKAPAPPK